jgi:hypothetical protein
VECAEGKLKMPNAPSEATLSDVIRYVLPYGTKNDRSGWSGICIWPPDLFAVVATITEKCGLYSEPAFMAYWGKGFELKSKWLKEVRKAGKEWALSGSPPKVATSLWDELFKRHFGARVIDQNVTALEWKKIIFRLLVIADEACEGVGFRPSVSAGRRKKREQSTIQFAVHSEYVAWGIKSASNPGAVGGTFLPNLPHSLCIAVPPEVVCVQPKTCTPSVGCTLRSLTHHLALLPSIGTVTTRWYVPDRAQQDGEPFNLLIVPYPFSVPGRSFKSSRGHFPGNKNDRTFTLDPDVWMQGAAPADFAKFLCELMEAAKLELEPIHAIVLPETALRLQFASDVAQILAQNTKLDLFLTGAVSGAGDDLRNVAAIYRYSAKRHMTWSFQSKHHRWCLNGDQIRRYNLGHVLDPRAKWWEQIDVSNRNCHVMPFRDGAALSVLVCEDLARYDPVLTVMNAIGPNLVVALLMDGPQLEQRWPGRYATALADDPGSAVLTVTSLGMVARSAMPGALQNREIALWKEPNGRAQELKLPRGDHALLLSLTSRRVEQVTLDGRSDGHATVNFSLGAAHGIMHPTPPLWLGRVP